MPSPSFSHYIRAMRQQPDRAGLVVLGNQAADLDSVASALVLAWQLSCGSPPHEAIGLIAIPRCDLVLRPEVLFILAQAELDPADLLFIDDLDLGGMLTQGAKLALVDHNRPETTLPLAVHQVMAILDHHEDTGAFPKASPRIIEPVGSTATLVAERLCRGMDPVDRTAALLLLGAILLDTGNLGAPAGRCTARDRAMAARLLEVTGRRQDDLFRDLHQARQELGGLSSGELLARDYKKWESPLGRYGMSSVLLSQVQWRQREPRLAPHLAAFAAAKGLELMVVLLIKQGDEFRREMLLYGRDKGLVHDLACFLNSEGAQLTAENTGGPEPAGPGWLASHCQGNRAMSRKELQPLIHRFLSEKGQGKTGKSDQSA
jgi:exopolyphosphatase